jgi:hypothetical protein
MGRESACRARLDGKSARGKALLETSELVFRSTVRGELRVAVPFKEMTVVRAGASDLTVVWGGGTLVLELPATEARRWAERIRNPPSRLDKLGVKATSKVALLAGAARGGQDYDDNDDNDDDASPSPGAASELRAFIAPARSELRAFMDEVEARGATILKGPPPATSGAEVVVFVAARARADLRQITRLAPALRAGGALWILRPKGSAAITEADVREAGRAAGLVDVKVAAFSPATTADKFVLPLAARAAAASPARPKITGRKITGRTLRRALGRRP